MDHQDIIKRKKYQNKKIGNQEYSFETSCLDPHYIQLRNFILKNIKLLEELNDYGMQFEYNEKVSNDDEFIINVNIKWHMNLEFNNAKILALITKRSSNSDAATFDLFTDDEKYTRLLEADQQKNINFAAYKCPVCKKARKDRKTLYAMILPSNNEMVFVGSECMKQFIPVHTLKKLDSIIEKLGQISNNINKIKENNNHELYTVESIMQEKYDKTINNDNSKNNIRNMLLEKQDVRKAFVKALRNKSNSIYNDYSDEEIQSFLDKTFKYSSNDNLINLCNANFNNIMQYIKQSRKIGSSKNNIRSMLHLLPSDMLFKDKAAINKYFMNTCKEYIVTNDNLINTITNKLIEDQRNKKIKEKEQQNINTLSSSLINLYDNLIKLIKNNSYELLTTSQVNYQDVANLYMKNIINDCTFEEHKCNIFIAKNVSITFELPSNNINKEQLKNDIRDKIRAILTKCEQKVSPIINEQIKKLSNKYQDKNLLYSTNLFQQHIFNNRNEFINYITSLMKQYNLAELLSLIDESNQELTNINMPNNEDEQLNIIQQYIKLNQLPKDWLVKLVKSNIEQQLESININTLNINLDNYIIADSNLLTDENLKVLKKNISKLLNTKDNKQKIIILKTLNTTMFKYDYIKYSKQQMRFNPRFFYNKKLQGYYQLYFKVNDNNIAHTNKWFNDELLNKYKNELSIKFADYLFKKLKTLSNKIIKDKQENILNKIGPLNSEDAIYKLFNLIIPKIVKSRIGILKTDFGIED